MMEDGALDAMMGGGAAAIHERHLKKPHHKKHHKKHHHHSHAGEHSESEPESDGVSDDDDVEENDVIAFDLDGKSNANSKGDLRASSSSRPYKRKTGTSSVRASEDAQAAAAGMKKVKNTPKAYSKV
jgi:hypothetical protein